jgi:hypothetical protein
LHSNPATIFFAILALFRWGAVLRQKLVSIDICAAPMLLIHIGFKSREPRIPGAPVISFN